MRHVTNRDGMPLPDLLRFPIPLSHRRCRLHFPKAFRCFLAHHWTAPAGPVVQPCVAVRQVIAGQVCLLSLRMGVRPYVRSRAGASLHVACPATQGWSGTVGVDNVERPISFHSSSDPNRPRRTPHLPCVAGQASCNDAPARERTLARAENKQTRPAIACLATTHGFATGSPRTGLQ